MKIAIYNRWLFVLGGGELHSAAIAMACRDQGHKVEILSQNPVPLSHLEERFRIDLTGIQLRELPKEASVEAVTAISGEYDLFVSSSNADFVPCEARYGWLLVFFPQELTANTWERRAINSYTAVYGNSSYTCEWIEKRWGVLSSPLWAPVYLPQEVRPKPTNREILSVGRFFPDLHSKRQDVLIDAFKALSKRLDSCHLRIIGGLDLTSRSQTRYFEELRASAKGFDISIEPNASREQLLRAFSDARLLWHAAGFGADPQREPERFEHFGISVVEGMGNGCIPLVYCGGGPQTTVRQGIDGFHWRTSLELENYTVEILESPQFETSLRETGLLRARNYSILHFNSLISRELRSLT